MSRCNGRCHCHAGPDGVMHPPCCEDCAPASSERALLPTPEIHDPSWPSGEWSVRHIRERGHYLIENVTRGGVIAVVRSRPLAYWIVGAVNAARAAPGATLSDAQVREAMAFRSISRPAPAEPDFNDPDYFASDDVGRAHREGTLKVRLIGEREE